MDTTPRQIVCSPNCSITTTSSRKDAEQPHIFSTICFKPLLMRWPRFHKNRLSAEKIIAFLFAFFLDKEICWPKIKHLVYIKEILENQERYGGIGGHLMLEEATRQSLSKALANLEDELENKLNEIKELEPKLETLKEDCEWIQSLIHQINNRLNEGIDLFADIDFAAAPPPHMKSTLNEVKPIEIPVEKGISMIFDTYKRPMKIKEIVAEFRERGWKLSQNHPQEVIRSALQRKPRLFKNVSRGTWKKIQRIAQFGPPPATGGEI